ncbi:MAG: hypothetical protein J7L72_06585 [Candidatus Aminicenantes bacterium]|nr:hypothetical protein [Candidatus Aminicenantes bacterium]
MEKIKMVLELAVLFFLLFVSVTCIPIGELQEDSRTVELEGARFVEARFYFGAGQIEIFGGTKNLLEGVFEYNIERWRPEINYRLEGAKGFLSVRQGDSSGIPAGNGRNYWDIYLNEDIPLDLMIDMGAGEGELDLKALNLTSLDIDIGVGELEVDISGRYQNDLDVVIDGGVGSTTVYLPRDTGVIVQADKGIGSISSRDFIKKGKYLVNEAYGKTDVEIRVDIDAGIGSITLKLR